MKAPRIGMFSSTFWIADFGFGPSVGGRPGLWLESVYFRGRI